MSEMADTLDDTQRETRLEQNVYYTKKCIMYKNASGLYPLLEVFF